MGKRWATEGLLLNARHVGAGSPRFDEGTQDARGPRSRLGRRAALVCAGLALAMLAVAAPAAASTTASTKTFNYTGDDQNWTVPARVTTATFDLRGAQGGQFLNHGIAGLGGQATATIGVTPGHTIEVNVGGQGTLHTGGFNGGGDSVLNLGAGGGGASDIRVGGDELDDRVLVAGGGGGTGNCSTVVQGTDGGDGGGKSGEDATGPASCSGTGGGGGTQTDGGSATGSATDGAFGVGGDAGVSGGGGGGGWYGGGGGFTGWGGGGGSGRGPTGTDFETGVRSGNGRVTVTYTVPAPIAPIEPPDSTPPPHGTPPPHSTPPPDSTPPLDDAPSNEFSFGKVKKNKNNGTAKLTVEVPGSGELDLAKTKKVKADEEVAEAEGEETLAIKPKGEAKQKLNDGGKAKVKAMVTFAPDGGESNTESMKVKLVTR